MSAALRFVVYDVDDVRRRWVSAPLGVRCVHLHNDPSTATLTLDADDDLVPILRAAGTRCAVEYRPATQDAWQRLWTGPVTERSGEGPEVTATAAFEVRDDLELLWGVLGWPNPAGDETEQGDEDATYTVTGPAETVLKTLVAANLGRYPALPLTVATDLARGDTITVAVRMQPLADVLFPALTQAGLGVSIVQPDDDPGLVLDVYEGTTHATTMTEASGVITGGAWVVTPPTVTRVVVGAAGAGTARVFRTFIDTALEAAWGPKYVREVFVDAADVAVDDPDRDDKLAERAAQALAEGAPTASVDCELAETDRFRYLGAVNLGDTVPVQLAGSPPLTATVTGAVLELTAGDGLVVAVQLGTPTDQLTRLFRTVAAHAARIRTIEAGR